MSRPKGSDQKQFRPLVEEIDHNLEVAVWGRFADRRYSSARMIVEGWTLRQMIGKGLPQSHLSNPTIQNRMESIERDTIKFVATANIVLDWTCDPKTNEIVIRHGDREIFRQPGSWEYYQFFVTACRILKKKYGWRLRDVVPSDQAEGDMWGDSFAASHYIDEIRRLIALDCLPPDTAMSSQAAEERQKWKTYCLNFD